MNIQPLSDSEVEEIERGYIERPFGLCREMRGWLLARQLASQQRERQRQAKAGESKQSKREDECY